ncbi:MAG: glycyl radical protein [Oscillospiraceae bacterium]|jgi:pyruvate formate-lyase/glycerol dehydratase family glycyl radical enzyme
MELTKRAKALRARMLTTPEVCVERGLYMTESYKETEGYPHVIRRARALEKILSCMGIRIEKGELIVGCHTSKIRGGALLPEISAEWILKEMDTVSTRDWDKYKPLSEEEKRCLLDYVPYWRGKSLNDQMKMAIPEEIMKLDHVAVSSAGFSENGHHFAHVAADYEKLLKIGINGMKREIEAEYASLRPEKFEDIHKRHLLDSMLICFDAVISFAERHAKLAEEMAAKTEDEEWKNELLEISRICRKVPAQPAGTFYEALQSCWFVFVALMIEGWGAGMSLGRADQYLYPYYKNDLTNGVLDETGAHELLCLLLIKMNGVINLQDETVAMMMGGYPVMQGVTVGGIDKNGEDAVNELSYMFIDAEQAVGLTSEDLVVRINKKNPDSFVLKACEAAKELRGKLKFVSDETTIQSMLSGGIEIEEARDYISTGCHNPTVPAVSHDIGGSSMNLPLILELALNDGISRITGERLGANTGDPRNFKSFDELLEAFFIQFEYITNRILLFKNVDLPLYAQVPCPLLSAFYKGCAQKGLDINEGGVKYCTHSTGISGVPNVGDGLAAIKKTVFDDKILTMDRVINLLDNNLEGDDEALYLLKKAPKFGNNDTYVDNITREVLKRACDYLMRHTTYAGIKTTPACLTMTINIPLGRMVGALPGGRKAGEPLSEGGISPHQGRNTSGVTSTMASVAALDQVKLTHGSILNIRISEAALKDKVSIKKFASLVRTFCEMGGNLVQFNFVSSEVLRDAQANPDKYRDLLVRVATYSAYFVELSPELQNDIINRAEFGAV